MGKLLDTSHNEPRDYSIYREPLRPLRPAYSSCRASPCRSSTNPRESSGRSWTAPTVDGDALSGDIAQISGWIADTRSFAIPETDHNLRQLITSMNGIMAGITETPSPTCRQVEVLHLHAQAIAATIRSDDDATDRVVMAFGEIGELGDGGLRRAAAD